MGAISDSPPGAALWRRLLADDHAQPAPSAAQSGFAAALTSPYAAWALLDQPAGQLDAVSVEQSRLHSLYMLQVQRQALAELAAAGVEAVAIKGFAHAHLHYRQPVIRIIGDLDILVPRQQVAAVIEAMRPRGFRFGAAHHPRWGFISDASYIPFHSPDGLCNIDIHVEPDAHPLHRGLDAALLRSQMRLVAVGDQRVAMPSATHQWVLLVSNAAKDRFFPSVLRKLIDAAALLRVEGAAIDWREAAAIAKRAQMSKALGTMLRLLRVLGLPIEMLGDRGLALVGPDGPMFRQLAGQWRNLSLAASPAIGLLREPALLYDWPAVIDRQRRRLSGLMRPQSGVPAQWREQS